MPKKKQELKSNICQDCGLVHTFDDICNDCKKKRGWLDNRLKLIGGSDAPIIVLGEHFGRTPVDLWQEKTKKNTKPRKKTNDRMTKGNQIEPILRELLQIENPELTIKHDEYEIHRNPEKEWQGGSLDGIGIEQSGDEIVIEIKSATCYSYDDLAKWGIYANKPMKYWESVIPDNYYCQVLHYLLVKTKAKGALVNAYITYINNQKSKYEQKQVFIRNYYIDRAEVEEDLKHVDGKEDEFWKCVETKTMPAIVIGGI